MRIAWLCKRRYMSKDVVDDRYGRLYELPRQLALRGHDVLGLCLDYRGRGVAEVEHEQPPGRLRWRTWGLGKLVLPGWLAHRRDVLRELQAFRPDVVIGASDSYHVVLAEALARRLGVPCAIDLYDNFESFGLTRVPGLRRAFRSAVARADAVACVSEPLREYVQSGYAARGNVFALESTIAPGAFAPRDRGEARARLGIEAHGRYVGHAGALDASRGIEVVYEAFEALSSSQPDATLLLAGPVGSPAVPSSPRVRYLGMLGHDKVADFFAALDVGVLCMKDSAFGRYSFPQKAYEMLSMRIPLAVARVGAMQDLLRDWPTCTYAADDAQELAQRLSAQLSEPVVPRVPVPTWADQAEKLEAALMQAVAQRRAGRST